jgi:phosphatidylglycerol lysyltransferase
LAALVVLAAVVLVLHHQFAHLHVKRVFAHLHAIPRHQVLAALGFTALSYYLLTTYETLGLAYLRRAIPYPRILLNSFIAYAFSHTLGFAAFTGAAIRLRLYASSRISAIDVATVSAFCSFSFGIGLATISGLSLVLAPGHAAMLLHLRPEWSQLVGLLLLAAVTAYAFWACLGRGTLEIRGWALRPPGPAIGLAQIALGVLDLSLSCAVLWSLLPAPVSYVTFLGVYAAAVIAGIISHIPGGVGVFEAVILLTLPGVPTDALLGSLLAYRAVYYLVPLVFGTVLFGSKEVAAQRGRIARAQELASAYIAPVVPQVAGALTFLAGALLLFSGATPAVDERLAFLDQFLPLAVLELSHLAGSLVGLGLLILSRALFRRVQAAYHISVWLLVAGIFASLLKGLDFEEASLLTLVLVVLVLGRRAFYRPTAILSEPLTPVWAASIVGVIAMAVWLGLVSYRHVNYSHELWWTFALEGNAPRMLRASLAVIVLALAYVLLYMLRPARPEPAVAGPEELARARGIIAAADSTLANAALTGDKRLLFNDAGDTFVMYQVAGHSWIALGDPIGTRAGAEDVVWRLHEMSDHHGGQTVFYQVCADRLALYVDLGLAALKIGEEARVSLADFSLEGGARAELRQAHRRAQRDGASFEVVPPEGVEAHMPVIERISDAWLAAKSTGEKRFSVGAFSAPYLKQFPLALVRAQGEICAFANLWTTGTKAELSVDLMRFDPGAPRSAMDFLFIELMLWGRREGYRWFNLGMAPLSGLEGRAIAPLWSRLGTLVYRHGEHFYNFQGLHQYKEKFDPVWEPRYLACPGGLALPRVLADVAALISRGFRGLVAK